MRSGNEINLQGEQYVFQRIFTHQELLSYAMQTDFRIVATYDDLDSTVDTMRNEADRLVMVLKRQEKRTGE